jgi:bacterioferritin (cytochrome b1)
MMLLNREEMRFDFGGAKFRLPRDRALLSWILDQFLYGEVTGIQCGHWLYRAPTLEAAQFFARQAVEELSHVQQFLRIYSLIGATPQKAHPLVRFLSTGAMGQDYAEHVANEMAIGEGLVLAIFYALIETIDDPAVVKILEAACRQEERHVAFGEAQTQQLLQKSTGLKHRLLGLNLLTLFAIRKLAHRVQKRLDKKHEVLRHIPAFVAALSAQLELRLQRMGVLEQPLSEISWVKKLWLFAAAYTSQPVRALRPNPPLLTQTYLRDPWIRSPE